MHGTTLALLAAIAHELAERENREAAGEFNFNLLWFVPGYLVAVAIHTAFNQFPDRPLIAMMGAAIFAPLSIMAIFHFGTAEAERWLDKEALSIAPSSTRSVPATGPIARAAARSPRSPAGSIPKAAKRIRRYWELQAWLVLEAEETMMEEAAGDATVDTPQVRAALAELGGLKRALGKGTFAALRALLPFSRNDHWEVSELKAAPRALDRQYAVRVSD